MSLYRRLHLIALVSLSACLLVCLSGCPQPGAPPSDQNGDTTPPDQTPSDQNGDTTQPDQTPSDGNGDTTEPPAAPSDPSPADGGTDVLVQGDLDWADASGATSYELYFGMTSPPSLVVNTTSSGWALPTLIANTTYYWQVVAKNDAGTASGPVWSFTTARRSQVSGSVVGWGSQVVGVDLSARFVKVAAAGINSLGLKADGSIVAWGTDDYGQSNVPEPNMGFVAIAAGGYHSLGLKGDGSIVAWGPNHRPSGNYTGPCDVPSPNRPLKNSFEHQS